MSSDRASFLCRAWFVSSSDSYVRGKLREEAILGHERCDLCACAIEEDQHSRGEKRWLSVSRAETECRRGFVDFPAVTRALLVFLNSILFEREKVLKHPLHVIYVCGLDHFNKCAAIEALASYNYIMCAVVYRKGYDEKHIRRVNALSKIIYVPLENERRQLQDISSTEIRTRLRNANGDAHHLTYDSVIHCLKQSR